MISKDLIKLKKRAIEILQREMDIKEIAIVLNLSEEEINKLLYSHKVYELI